MTDQPLAVVTSHESLREAFRIAKLMRNFSNQFCDERGGLTSGQTDKILGPTETRGLGPITIDTFCTLFAVKFVMVPDPEAEERMRATWEGRENRNVRTHAHRMSKDLLDRARPLIFKEMSKRAAIARKLKISAPMRAKIAKRAARARWRKQRALAKAAIDPASPPPSTDRTASHTPTGPSCL